MARNVEIKARAGDFRKLMAVAERLSRTSGQLIEQEDTFFHVFKGRLKLRTFSPSEGELVYYEREDQRGPTESRYLIARTADPSALKETLAAALGVRGIVRKRRHLYLVGQTRIHLDEVDGLGHFIELEVVLDPGQDVREGQRIAEHLMAELEIEDDELLDKAYIDLVE